MHLEVLCFPSMTFGYSNRDSQEFGASLSNSQYSSKLKNLLIPFQCNEFSLPIFICRVLCDTLREAHRLYFLIPTFVNIHHCTINNLSAAFIQQHKVSDTKPAQEYLCYSWLPQSLAFIVTSQQCLYLCSYHAATMDLWPKAML